MTSIIYKDITYKLKLNVRIEIQNLYFKLQKKPKNVPLPRSTEFSFLLEHQILLSIL